MVRPKGPPLEPLVVRVPADLLERVRDKLADPMRNKTKHGGMKELVTHLLYRWLDDNNPKSKSLDDL